MNRTIFNCNKKEIQKINLIDNHLIDVNSPDKMINAHILVVHSKLS